MRSPLRVVLLLAVLLAGCVGEVLGQPSPQDAVRMQNVVREFVRTTGHEVVGLGSWIAGGYRPGSSDHDLRLILPQGAGVEEAGRAWAGARAQLARLMEAEFGRDAARMMGTTNLYPPTQLMRGVQTAEEALARFVQIGQVPSLAPGATPGMPMATRFWEGLYGTGATSWNQQYEKGRGRLFYRVGNRVFTGFTDLQHLIEGVEQQTVGGRTNTALQWIDHALSAMNRQAPSPQEVAKHLARLEQDLVKARDLARCGANFPLREELRLLQSHLEKGGPGALNALRPEIERVMRQARLQACTLSRYDRAGAFGQAGLRRLVTSLDDNPTVRSQLFELAERVGADRLGFVIGSLFNISAASTALGEGDPGKAFTDMLWHPFGVKLGGVDAALIPAAFLTWITQMCIDAAKDAGYEFVANGQEAFDLLAGFFTAPGRAAISDRSFALDELVKYCQTEEHVRSFVWKRCQEAAARDAGPATGATDERAAEAMFNRLCPVILAAWTARREMLFSAFMETAGRVADGRLQVSYSPTPAKLVDGIVVVNTEVADSNKTVVKDLDSMRGIMAVMAGPNTKVEIATNYEWVCGKATSYLKPTAVFQFKEPGVYPVQVTRTILLVAPGLPPDHPFRRKYLQVARVDVEVMGDKPVVAVTPTPTSASTSAMESAGPASEVPFEVAGLSLGKGRDNPFSPGDLTVVEVDGAMKISGRITFQRGGPVRLLPHDPADPAVVRVAVKPDSEVWLDVPEVTVSPSPWHYCLKNGYRKSETYSFRSFVIDVMGVSATNDVWRRAKVAPLDSDSKMAFEVHGSRTNRIAFTLARGDHITIGLHVEFDARIEYPDGGNSDQTGVYDQMPLRPLVTVVAVDG